MRHTAAALYLTKNAAYSPLFVARLAEKNGYCVPGNGSSWTLISEGSALLGLSAAELPLWEQSMKNALDSGALIILALGPGDFTSSGHFVVITGYDSCGFTVNDPNSPDNSAKHWTYDRLSPQISNLWFLEANRDTRDICIRSCVNSPLKIAAKKSLRMRRSRRDPGRCTGLCSSNRR